MSVVRRYHVREGADLDHLLAEIQRRLVLESESESTSSRTVYDTFDWRLYGEGTVFEVDAEGDGVWRSFDQGTVLGRYPALGAPGFAWDLPKSPATHRLASLVDMRRLLPLVSIHSTRTVLRVLDDERKTIGRVIVDEAVLESADRDVSAELPRLPPVLEVVSVRGYEKKLGTVNDLLGAQVLLAPAEDDASVLAMRAVGLRPGAYRSKLKLSLDGDVPAWKTWVHVLGVLFAAVVDNEQGVRDDVDSEFLHDYRVAVRRTRSVLGEAKGVLPPDDLAYFRDEFKWLGGVTGPTRDFDVFLLEVPAFRRGLPVERRDDLDPFAGFLADQQRVSHAALVAALDTERYRTLIDRWAAFLAAPGLDERAGASPEQLADAGVALAFEPPAVVAAKRIEKAHRRLIRDGNVIHDDSEPEKLHDLRKDSKRLRYLFECFGSLLDAEAVAGVVKELKALQDVLGEYQDCQVQIGSLEQFGQQMLDEAGAPASALLAMGALVDQLAEREQAARDAFDKRFKAFDSKSVRRTVRELVDVVSDDGASGSSSPADAKLARPAGSGPAARAAENGRPARAAESGKEETTS